MSEVKAKLGLDKNKFSQGIVDAMSDVTKFSSETQQEMGKVSDKALGIATTTEASSQKQRQSWSRVGKSIGAVALISGGLFKSMVSASPGLSSAFAEMNFMFEEMFMVLGEQLAPVIEDTLVPAVEALTDFIINLDDKTQLWIATIISAISFVSVLSSGLSLLGLSFGFLLGPVGLVILAIAAFALAYHTNFLGVRDITDEVISYITDALKKFVDDHAEQIGKIVDLFVDMWNVVGPILESFGNFLVKTLGDQVQFVFDIILIVVDQILDMVEGLMTIIKGIFTLDMQMILDGLLIMFVGTFENIVKIIETAIFFIGDLLSNFADLLRDIFGTGIQAVFDPIIDAFLWVINKAIDVYNAIPGVDNISHVGRGETERGETYETGNYGGDYHTGGVIPGIKGEEVMIKALAGEVVYNPSLGQTASTFDNSQSMNITNKINIYNPQLPDRRAQRNLIRDVDRGLRKLQNRYPSGRS